MADWTYSKIFRVPTGKIPGGIPARVLVAYKPFEGIDRSDPLNEIYGWVRMVVWLPDRTDQTDVTAHVNISSNELYEVVKARLQGFQRSGRSIYLIDYAAAELGGPDAERAFETRSGEDPWEESKIEPPEVLTNEDKTLRAKRRRITRVT